MISTETRAAILLVTVGAGLYAIGCGGSAFSGGAGDAAAEGATGGSGSTGGSGAAGSSGSSGGSGATGSSGSSGGSGATGSSGSTGSPGASSGSSGSGAGSASSSGSTSSSGGSGSSGSSGAKDAGNDVGACTTDADCSPGDRCGFPESAGCSAVGACFPAPGAICNAIVLACACDGSSLNAACNGLPGGYTTKPFAHLGPCGLDAGAGSGSGSGGSSSSGGSGGSGSSGGRRDAGSFSCGSSPCDIATEFCFESGGGALPPDGASNFTWACKPIPAPCQAEPTCACLIAADAGTNGCPCTALAGGGLLAACLYP